MVDVKPVAWRFELARSRVWVDGRPAEWTDWSRPKVSLVEPCVPEGSIRNLTPLYEQPNTPTEDVVEKVARAAYAAHHYAGPTEEAYLEPNWGRSTVERPSGFKTERMVWEAVARAAIEALGG
jgi:hypothetical protein